MYASTFWVYWNLERYFWQLEILFRPYYCRMLREEAVCNGWAVSNFKTMSSTGSSLLQLRFIDRSVSSLALWAEQDQLLLGRPELCLAQRLSSDGAAYLQCCRCPGAVFQQSPLCEDFGLAVPVVCKSCWWTGFFGIVECVLKTR